ncbi:hypothetical protein SPURM210S_06502 [Streptomyces purpurascens]
MRRRRHPDHPIVPLRHPRVHAHADEEPARRDRGHRARPFRAARVRGNDRGRHRRAGRHVATHLLPVLRDEGGRGTGPEPSLRSTAHRTARRACGGAALRREAEQCERFGLPACRVRHPGVGVAGRPGPGRRGPRGRRRRARDARPPGARPQLRRLLHGRGAKGAGAARRPRHLSADLPTSRRRGRPARSVPRAWWRNDRGQQPVGDGRLRVLGSRTGPGGGVGGVPARAGTSASGACRRRLRRSGLDGGTRRGHRRGSRTDRRRRAQRGRRTDRGPLPAVPGP